MKKSMKLLIVSMLAFSLGLAAGNYAVSDVPSNFKVAVVDVQKVVAASGQVKTLTQEQASQRESLSKFISKASDEIKKEKDETKKKALEEKYNKEFKTKQESIVKNYEKKLLEIDKNISSVITSKAKANGYNLVLSKSIVLSGGTDITEEISKELLQECGVIRRMLVKSINTAKGSTQ